MHKVVQETINDIEEDDDALQDEIEISHDTVK